MQEQFVNLISILLFQVVFLPVQAGSQVLSQLIIEHLPTLLNSIEALKQFEQLIKPSVVDIVILRNNDRDNDVVVVLVHGLVIFAMEISRLYIEDFGQSEECPNGRVA